MLPASAQQADGFAAALGPYRASDGVRASYRGAYATRRPTEPSSPQLGTLQHEAHVFGSLSSNEERDVSANAHFRLYDFLGKDLRTTGRDFSTPLWDIGAGPAFRKRLSDGDVWGGNFSVGSASDKPFHSWHEMTVQANTYYRLQSAASNLKNAWIFLVNYSNNRSFANHIPLPGFAYWWEPSESFRALIGLPFLNLSIKPTNKLGFNLTYFAPWAASFQASYRIVGPLQGYGAFQWGNKSYYLAERTDKRERLFYDEKKASLGVRSPVSKALYLDLSAGYAFDRIFFKGEKFRHRNEAVRVGNGWVFSTQLSAHVM